MRNHTLLMTRRLKHYLQQRSKAFENFPNTSSKVPPCKKFDALGVLGICRYKPSRLRAQFKTECQLAEISTRTPPPAHTRAQPNKNKKHTPLVYSLQLLYIAADTAKLCTGYVHIMTTWQCTVKPRKLCACCNCFIPPAGTENMYHQG